MAGYQFGGSYSFRQLGAACTSGGRAYVEAIASCAKKGKADEILTWNVRHFSGASGITAVTPG